MNYFALPFLLLFVCGYLWAGFSTLYQEYRDKMQWERGQKMAEIYVRRFQERVRNARLRLPCEFGTYWAGAAAFFAPLVCWFLRGFVPGLLCIGFRHELAMLGCSVSRNSGFVINFRVQVDPDHPFRLGIGNFSSGRWGCGRCFRLGRLWLSVGAGPLGPIKRRLQKKAARRWPALRLTIVVDRFMQISLLRAFTRSDRVPGVRRGAALIPLTRRNWQALRFAAYFWQRRTNQRERPGPPLWFEGRSPKLVCFPFFLRPVLDGSGSSFQEGLLGRLTPQRVAESGREPSRTAVAPAPS